METPKKAQDNDSAKEKDFSLSLDPNVAWGKILAFQEFLTVPTISTKNSKWNAGEGKSECTRIVCMSDTHGQHRDIAVPKGDILIHGGDFTETGEVFMVQDMIQYFQELKFPTTVCIAGNHDMTLDLNYYQRSWRRFHKRQLNSELAKRSMNEAMMQETSNEGKFYYLQDSSCQIPINTTGNDDDGKPKTLSVYGSPWSPEFYDWAFNVHRGQAAYEIWSQIPSGTDILVTHGPPLGRGDLCEHGGRAGCYDLLQQVQERVQPRIMVFGHIHEGFGTTYDGTTLFVNASNLDLDYDNVHPCTVIDLPHDINRPPRVVRPHCQLQGDGDELLAWLGKNGYDLLVDVMKRSNISPQQLPLGDALLDTPTAYKSIVQELQFTEYQDLKAKGELRKALLQIYAESF